MQKQCVPVSEEGVHHAAVEDTQGQPHQHGHRVLGQGIGEAVFGHSHSAPCQRKAGITQRQDQGAVGGGVVHHRRLLLRVWRNTEMKSDVLQRNTNGHVHALFQRRILWNSYLNILNTKQLYDSLRSTITWEWMGWIFFLYGTEMSTWNAWKAILSYYISVRHIY